MLDFITWTANPDIIHSFITIRWYGLMFAIGFIIGYNIDAKIFKHEGAPESWLGTLLMWTVAGTIIGVLICRCRVRRPKERASLSPSRRRERG